MSSNAYYLAQIAIVVALVMVSSSAAGCETLGDVFQAGLFAGILGVVLLIVAIGLVVRALRSKDTSAA